MKFIKNILLVKPIIDTFYRLFFRNTRLIQRFQSRGVTQTLSIELKDKIGEIRQSVYVRDCNGV